MSIDAAARDIAYVMAAGIADGFAKATGRPVDLDWMERNKKDWIPLVAAILRKHFPAEPVTREHELLRLAAQAALEHVTELRDAWMRGALSEHDGLGGTRSNRNADVERRLYQALNIPTERPAACGGERK